MAKAKFGNVNQLWESPVPDKVVSFLAYNGALEHIARDGLSKLGSGTANEKEQFVQQLGLGTSVTPEDVTDIYGSWVVETYKIGRMFGVTYSVETQPSTYNVTMDTPNGRIERSIPIQTPNNPMMSCMMGVALAGNYVTDYVGSRWSAGALKGTALENVVNSLAQVTHSVLPNIRRMIGGK